MHGKRMVIHWVLCCGLLFSLGGCQNSSAPHQTPPKRQTPMAWFQTLIALIRPATPNTAATLEEHAQRFHTEGRQALAEKHFRMALVIRENAWGGAHLNVAPSLDLLAAYYVDQKRYDEAEPLQKRALAIRENTLGPEHPDVAMTLSNYAMLLRQTGRDQEAVPLEQRAQAIRGK